MSAAANAKGLKRICTGCGTRFYDFNKRPIVCPGCQVEFTGEQKVKVRRGRAVAEKEAESQVSKKTAKQAANDESSAEEAGDGETISLEDVKKIEDGADVDDDDIDLDDDDLDAGIEADGLDEDDLKEDLDVDLTKAKE